ncbi:SNF2 family N-terminal domain-containing protein [Thelonectria olida]|uniref:SNF2 family N-terminal domain-containing protein n=1 Tax=Thelonectria olida TaxID=1576542 RepID=A0A9P8WC65_9HYPO|nr:SNF2 family N-terminal domain-containing protein [Thelonectria olida]
MPPRKAKRAHEVIDLTETQPNKRRAERPPHATPGVPAGTGGTSVYNNASSGYASSTSQLPPTQASQQVPLVEPDVLDLTQDDDGPTLELYGSFAGKIVGVRYYKGYASPGEMVLCRREPHNQYDPNAIRVDNVVGAQIGHIPRNVAMKITPLVDRGDVTIEAQIMGEKAFYDCPVRIFFYGPSDPAERSRIETLLKKDKLVKATELNNTRKDAEARRALMGLKSGGPGNNIGPGEVAEPEVSLETLLQNSESVEMRKGGDAIKDLAIGEEQLEQMPKADQPSQLKSQLLPYQLQGLAWMTSKENPKIPEKGSKDVVQLWRRDHKGRYWNIASDFVTTTMPQLLSGGILADDMGLGKTLQIISLILTGDKGSTLIVAPVSVMSNWEQQIRRHVLPDHLPSVFIYHGDKKVTAKALMQYDVVVTSYGKLAREREAGVRKVLLAQDIEWRRVVLDEGHTIRNSRTKVALASCDIRAKSRWVLTGTPIINSVKDLHSLLKFLHITGGIEQSEIFNAKITRRLGSNDRSAEILLQALMQDLCLRRRKDMKFVDLRLPEKKEFIHRIPFRPEEKHKYEALLSEARGVLEEYQANSSAGQKGRFQNVLERLLRLRQTCNHWTLCRERIADLLKLLDNEDVVTLNDKTRALLQEALRLYIESQEDCAICYDTPTEPVITTCKHVFCKGCITRAIQIQGKCPMCRNRLTDESLLEPAPETSGEAPTLDSETQSSKTEAMLQIVQATLRNDGSKVIIFSQWTSFLNILQNVLKEADINFTRIDGSMKAEQRDRAISALDNDPDTRVLLASLAVCSVGLNLVSADTVILSDSWWAPAIEDQAVDRVHRLGQTRPTTVWRLVMEDSVEERVLDIQSEKRELVTKAFQEKTGQKKKAKDTRMADVLKLLG